MYNMKKIGLLFLFSSISILVTAQNFGVRAGANLAKITGGGEEVDNSTIFTWQFGKSSLQIRN